MNWETAPDTLKAKEVADLLRCHPITVYRRLEAGHWSAFAWKLGSGWRIDKGPLRKHLESHPVETRERSPDPMPKPSRVRFRANLESTRRRAMA